MITHSNSGCKFYQRIGEKEKERVRSGGDPIRALGPNLSLKAKDREKEREKLMITHSSCGCKFHQRRREKEKERVRSGGDPIPDLDQNL